MALAVSAQFTAITNGPVVTEHGDSTGCAWGDYDKDGDLDLFVSNFGTPLNYLYRNNGDDSFTRVTEGTIATDDTNSEGAIWADYDNDGDLDLFVAVGLAGNDLLYRNNGDGSFTKITSGPVVQSGGNSRGCAWGDYDNDGRLDLFVANEQGQNNFLFHNEGSGTFTKISSGSIVNDGGASYGCAWGDYDNDGYLDLFVANLNQNNFLYHNNRDGTFTRITSGRIANEGGASQGCAWGDYDNDGFLDLFVANRNQKNFLYHNEGDGTFTAITNGSIVNDTGYSWSPSWVDYDNDGFLDLFVANGPVSGAGQNNFLYHNNGDGTFTRVMTGAVVSDGASSGGCAWGDYNNDGFVDLFVSNLNGQNNLLYRNEGNSNNWLTVRCLGQLSNGSGIGAKVRIKMTQQSGWQMREISGGSGYGSQNAPYAYFGVGVETNIAVLRLEWPSGIVQELRNVPSKQFLTVTEPAVSIVPASLAMNRGETATLTVSAALSPSPQFQWFHHGRPIPGAITASLILSNIQANDVGDYAVRLEQTETATTVFPKSVDLIGPIVLLSNPQRITARPNSNVTLQVTLTGAPPIALQWKHGTQRIPDATNALLTLTNVQLVDDGEYSVIASNSYGAVESQQATLVILIKPAITVHPLSQSVVAGGSVTLSVSATGNPLPLTFRWRSNNVPVLTLTVFETNSFLTIPHLHPISTTNQFHFAVGVTNLAGGSSLSSDAVLTVLTDSDNDGLPDDWESVQGLNLTDSIDAGLDSDGDGATNLEEYRAGTDPHDPQDHLRLTVVRRDDPNSWMLRFLAASNQTYTLQSLGRFTLDEDWRSATDVVAAPTNRIVEIIQPRRDAQQQQFFRLLTPRSP
jgi:hypothetical protein